MKINGKFLSATPTGVHRVAVELIRQMETRRMELTELFPDGTSIQAPRNAVNGERGETPFPLDRTSVLTGQLWEQFELPIRARGHLLLSLCNLAPLSTTDAITMIHDAQVFITPQSYSRAFATAYQFLLPQIGRRHRRVLTVSHFSADQLAVFGIADRSRIEVIHNGVDHVQCSASQPEVLERFALSPGRYVVALANGQAHKNIVVLLRAFGAAALSGLKLVLFGGASRTELAALHSPLPSNLVLAGRLNDGQLRALLESALCFATPSRTEGFGLPPLEAMYLGTPAVVTRCGALPEVCGDAGLYCDPDAPEEWVDAINALASNAQHMAARRRFAAEHAAQFTWSAAGDRLMEVLREVEEERRREHASRRR